VIASYAAAAAAVWSVCVLAVLSCTIDRFVLPVYKRSFSAGFTYLQSSASFSSPGCRLAELVMWTVGIVFVCLLTRVSRIVTAEHRDM